MRVDDVLDEVEEGEALFEAPLCGVCHRPDTGKMNLSLREIAKAYQGKDGQLIKDLLGEADSVAKPKKADVMKRSFERRKGLTDDKQRALADFILSYGK